MGIGTAKCTNKALVAIFAIAVAFAATLSATVAEQALAADGAADLAAAQLVVQADDGSEQDVDQRDYYIFFEGAPYRGAYGICGKPGEKITLKANVGYYDVAEAYNNVEVKDAKVEWKPNSKLKAKVNGNKLVIKKLPKAGKYKVKVTAYSADGTTKLETQTLTIVVKKKPAVKIMMPKYGSKGLVSKNVSKVKKGEMFHMELNGASWAWDNNTKKSFYALKIKDLATGKVTTFSAKKGSFKKNAFVTAASVAGGNTPMLIGEFKKAGKYKITATIYHSNKKLVTATKTVTVK